MKKTLCAAICLTLIVAVAAFCGACSLGGNKNKPVDNVNNSSGYVLNFGTVYAMAEESGYTGTLEDLIALFKGKNAYELAVAAGYTGTQAQWLASLVGAAGKDGVTPSIGSNKHWYIGELDTGVVAEGKDGINGNDGRGIAGTYINDEGYLVVVYTDETEQRLDKVKDIHPHEIVEQVIIEKVPTCSKPGITYIVCATCGELLKTYITPLVSHTYNDVVTTPNCTERGYTTHTCSVCGYVLVDSYTDPVDSYHVDANGDGKCDLCGQVETYHYEDVHPALTGYALPEDPEDVDALKELACALYNKANELAQKCDHRYAASTYIVKSGVKMGKTIMGASVTEMVYVIKSGTEYYKLDYQPSLNAFGSTLAQGHGKATYASMALEKAYFVQVGDSEKTDVGYHADFTDQDQITEIKWVDIPYFYGEQEIKYTETEIGVLPETIESVIVTHNDEEGYWHIELGFDVSNPKTTEILLPELRANEATEDATYESISTEIEIWDNGMYKLFKSLLEWNGSIAGTVDCQTVISYSAAMCDLSRYEFFNEIKQQAQNVN